MNIQDLKANLIEMINQSEDSDWLNDQLAFAKKSKDWWDQFSEEERKKLKESIAQAERGEFVPHEKVKAILRKWS